MRRLRASSLPPIDSTHQASPSLEAPQAATPLILGIRPRALLIALLCMSAALCGSYGALEYGRWPYTARLRYMLMPWAEASVGAWLSAAMLGAAAALALVKGAGLRCAGRAGWGAYLVVAGALAMLSLDEGATLHENVGLTVYHRLGSWLNLGAPEKYELLPDAIYGLAGLVALVVLRRSFVVLWREGKGNASLVAGVLLLVAGGVVIDAIPRPWEWRLYLGAVEELVEMSGGALLVHGMLWKLGTGVTLKVVE